MTEAVVVGLNTLTIEKVVIEEKATKGLVASLYMAIEEKGEVGGDSKEEADANQGALGSI